MGIFQIFSSKDHRFLSDPSPIIGNACQWLTDWLNHSLTRLDRCDCWHPRGHSLTDARSGLLVKFNHFETNKIYLQWGHLTCKAIKNVKQFVIKLSKSYQNQFNSLMLSIGRLPSVKYHKQRLLSHKHIWTIMGLSSHKDLTIWPVRTGYFSISADISDLFCNCHEGIFLIWSKMFSREYDLSLIWEDHWIMSSSENMTGQINVYSLTHVCAM